MSERTLSRRLTAVGSSFRQELATVREHQARILLQDPHRAVYEVSFLLGYAETSVFHRSFQRWLGCSPGEWRLREGIR